MIEIINIYYKTMPATQKQDTFQREASVTTRISASQQRIWELLTNVDKFTSWNSTITSMSGTIGPNGNVALTSTSDPKRTFKIKITGFEPTSKMVWESGMAPMFKGVRVFTLNPQSDGTTEFTMTETLRGIMFPLIAPSLPDFRPFFDTYAVDLKREAEKA